MASFLKETAQRFDAATISRVDGGGVYALAAEKPSDPGHYAILYVGEASDLRSRLYQHLEARRPDETVQYILSTAPRPP
jgi:excinuclease UvrABC nuclease subunit